MVETMWAEDRETVGADDRPTVRSADPGAKTEGQAAPIGRPSFLRLPDWREATNPSGRTPDPGLREDIRHRETISLMYVTQTRWFCISR